MLTYFTNSDIHSHTGCNGDVCHDFNGDDVDSHHQDTQKKFIAHWLIDLLSFGSTADTWIFQTRK